MNYFLSFLFFVTISSVFAQEKRKPNVLFIISDDLTANAISSYGNPVVQTPHIDALAKEGVQYMSAYSQYPVCGPSRASLMFGYYPTATKTYGYVSGRDAVGEQRKSWAQVFKDNGYYTTRVSKIFHMGVPIDIEKGIDGADDVASWTERFNSQGPEWKATGNGELVQNNPYGTKPIQGGNVMTIVKADGDDLVHSDGRTAEKASELIRKHKEKPFLLAVGLVRPHVPFVAPEKYFDAYPYAKIVLPPKVVDDWNDIPEKGINYVTTLNAHMSEEQKKKAIAAYYASVSYMDAQVGKVLKTLKDEGLEENTIIVFTSDHGFHLGEHDFWMKVSLHEESVRVPLIIKVPGKAPGVSYSLVELLDLYPTLTELTGIKVNQELQGKSLVKTLDNPDEQVRDLAFSVSASGNKDGQAFLIRSKKWSYIQYEEDATGGMELYDMETDVKQFNNLAYLPQYESVLQEMKERLRVKLMEVRENDLGIKQ